MEQALKRLESQVDTLASQRRASLAKYNEQLRKSSELLAKAAINTDDETKAVKLYVDALANASAAQTRQNRLLDEEIKKRGLATSELKKYNAAATPPRSRTSMAGRYLRPQAIRGQTAFSAPIGPGPASSTALSSPLPYSQMRMRNKQLLAEEKALQEGLLRLEQKSAATFNKKLETQGKINAATADEVRLITQRVKLQKGETMYSFRTPIGPFPAPNRLSSLGASLGMPTFAGMAGRGARGLRGIGGRFAKAGGVGGVLSRALPGAAISAAFPLLTGQGAGGAIGGGIGGLAGGVLGSILGPGGAAMGSFAGGLIGSIIGEKFDEAKALTKELKTQQELLRGLNDLETRGLKLTIDIAKARQQGNKIQAIELERRQKNNQIAQQLFKTITKLDADERNKTEAGRKLVEFEKNRAGQVAKQAVDQNNILSAMRKQSAELEKQLQASSMLTERRLAGVGAKEARGQQKFDVATARFDMLLKINDLELQRARNAGETAKEYKLQLHRANLIYKQTLLQIKQELQRNKLAAIREKIELLGLQSELRQRQRAGENVDFLVQEINLRRQAVQIANEGVTAAEQMAAFQIRGAEAVRTMAIEQLKYNKNKAAGETRAAGFAGAGSGTGATVVGYSGTRSIGALTDQQIATRLSELGVTGTFTPTQASALLNRTGQVRRAQAAENYIRSMQGRQFTSIGLNKHLQSRGYAEGGYVTRPTNAVIGEAGESEYVIPASKMNRAMQRYSAGVRGEAVTAGAVGAGSTTNANYSSQQNMYYGGGGTSVNITTGPVIRMDNRDYVTMADMQRGMAAAANAGQANIMRQMQRSYTARRSMGL